MEVLQLCCRRAPVLQGALFTGGMGQIHGGGLVTVLQAGVDGGEYWGAASQS